MRRDPALVPAPPVPRDAFEAGRLSSAERRRLLAAGREVRECRRVLRKAGLNVVSEVLKGQGAFVELDHFPADDVFDDDTASQYYYHAHRDGEHGHFHTFVRARGMPDGIAPMPHDDATEPWPEGTDALSHLIAISMDAYGDPVGLFATNRWVTGEAWYRADDVLRMLDRFAIDHAWPSWPTNRWLTAMLVLFRPQIEALVRHRDAAIEHWQATHPAIDVFEDRALEVTHWLPIAVDAWIDELHRAEAANALPNPFPFTHDGVLPSCQFNRS